MPVTRNKKVTEEPLLRRIVNHVENVLLKREKQSSYNMCSQTVADIVVNTDFESESESPQHIYELNPSYSLGNEGIAFLEPIGDDISITSDQNKDEIDGSAESIDVDDVIPFEETGDEDVFAFEETLDVEEESGPKKVTL